MAAKKRKARGDSKLDTLPLEKKKELIDGLVCGWTYAAAQEWLSAECGVSVSGSAWTPFYGRHVEPILQDIKNFALMSAQSLSDQADATRVFTEATKAAFVENAYQLMRSPGADAEEKRKWMETLIKDAASNRDDRKLSMASKGQIEKGLDALFEEIKGNKKAEALFAQLREAVSQA